MGVHRKDCSIGFWGLIERKNKLTRLIIKIIDDYLNDIEASKFDLPFISQKISNINILDREVNKTVSIFEPLIERDSQYFDKKFFKVKDDEKRVKSLYKKLVQLHHPDKWNHFDKSKAITDRLNFNFNNLRNAYEKALS